MPDYNFVITTESNSEIPFQWEDTYGVPVLRMPYTLNGEEIYYDLGRNTDIPAFYKKMREGATLITTQRNPNEIVEYFTPFLKEGKDILHIAFSSALSGTFNSEVLAVKELKETFPERTIELVDTLAISMALGQLVEAAYNMQKEGKTLYEIKDWVESNKQRSCALFTVDSLEYLRRGGRVSGAAAFFGNVLEVKPVLYISPSGKLQPIEKIKGRKKSLKFMAEKCLATIENPTEQTVTIMHADCLNDAQLFLGYLNEAMPQLKTRLMEVGPVIGSHCGPGTIAILYFGRNRSEIKAEDGQ